MFMTGYRLSELLIFLLNASEGRNYTYIIENIPTVKLSSNIETEAKNIY